jgi:ABC-2 type transport system permease protein
MKALLHLTAVSLKLNFRNRMAILYGYLFPLIFLVAFWTIYRNDPVPLALHVGQFLTVTVLGSACFGLPTTIVSERERGVWRRYALAPVGRWVFVAGVLLSRAVLLLSAALLQLALAFALGLPMPTHPLDLLIALCVAAAAFLSFGMVIAMLVDNVPAVQALGQCIFLPMLMIGGSGGAAAEPARMGAAHLRFLSRPLCGGSDAAFGHRQRSFERWF